MTLAIVERTSDLPHPAGAVYAWHARPGAFERLAPPWEPVTVVERHGTIEEGRVTLRVPLGPLRTTWMAEHHDGIPGREFRDRQVKGPFETWHHIHRFEPREDGGCRMMDRVEFRLPLGGIGGLADGMVRERIERMLRYRHDTLRADLAAHAAGPAAPLRVAISGASGLIGTTLRAFLTTGGHEVAAITRGRPGPAAIHWDPRAGTIESPRLEGFDAVVHLAAENIAGSRWDTETKQRIMESRRQGTEVLAEALATRSNPPRVLVSSSAIGYYGDRGADILEESSLPGEGFLPRVAVAWERSADAARQAGIRVVHPRTATVLTPAGGALERLLVPFRLGVGGRLGSGRQWMSWISIDDLVGAIHHAIITPAMDGPMNAAAPDPVTNTGFTRILARVLGRPALVPVPALALRIALGEMADPLLLASARVRPGALLRSGYRFRHPDLETALRHLLGRWESPAG